MAMGLLRACLLLLALAAPHLALLARNQNQTDECQCLSWASVYKNKQSFCGGAFELAAASAWRDPENKRLGGLKNVNKGYPATAVEYLTSGVNLTGTTENWMAKEYCSDFFTKIESNVCLNVAPTSTRKWFGQSWCYVSKTCSQLNGGIPSVGIGGKVSAKFCNPKLGDEPLCEKTPPQLLKWVEKEHLKRHLPTAVRFAYPYGGENWTHVQPATQPGQEYRVHADSLARVPVLQYTMKMNPARPVFYNYGDRSSVPIVVFGQSLWSLWSWKTAKCEAGCA